MPPNRGFVALEFPVWSSNIGGEEENLLCQQADRARGPITPSSLAAKTYDQGVLYNRPRMNMDSHYNSQSIPGRLRNLNPHWELLCFAEPACCPAV